ncbi:hypothetical protein ACOMHN_034211 [Nucella lapillus]
MKMTPFSAVSEMFETLRARQLQQTRRTALATGAKKQKERLTRRGTPPLPLPEISTKDDQNGKTLTATVLTANRVHSRYKGSTPQMCFGPK